jgi:hypothetical protein
MKTSILVEKLGANVVCGKEHLEAKEIEHAFASDLMSDVLTINAKNMLLITGMANIQTIRTAEMADIHTIVLVRNKKATPEMIELAVQNDMIIAESTNSMFKTSGILYNMGVKPVY